MRVVLFDLGKTLLDEHDVPLPGAIDMLRVVADLRDRQGAPLPIALVSDYYEATPQITVAQRKDAYCAILKRAGIDRFFQPFETRVTLSTEVGVDKPDPLIFRTAIDRLVADAPWHEAMLVTENPDHVRAARALGMLAVHFKGPGEPEGEIAALGDLVPILRAMLAASPCAKTPAAATGRHASLARNARAADPGIAALTIKIDPDRLRRRIEALTGFGTRWTYAPGVSRVPDWVRDQFKSMGYTDEKIRFQDFSVPGRAPQKNVLCGVDPTHPGFIVLTAHYDSLSETPATRAPGADDNASGIAVLLEVAQVLRGVPVRRGLLFAAFGGEEQGLLGSTQCAERAAGEGWRIELVVNMDMVGYRDPANPDRIIVEYDQGNAHPGNDEAARSFGLVMAQMAAEHTSLSVEHTDIWNSDYMPFEAKGYPCIGVYEAAQNPGYHKTTDTQDRLDMNHLAQIAKMVLATVARVAR